MMNWQQEKTQEFAERIARVETKQNSQDGVLQKHELILDDLNTKFASLVSEVKQIRNALYFMAAAIAANVPALNKLLSQVSAIFSGGF